MPAELRLYGTDDHSLLALKGGLLEFRDHLPLPEPTEFASLLARGALRDLLRQIGKVLARLDALYQLLCLVFITDQDMRTIHLGCHVEPDRDFGL
jgi:hypothetical protein